MNGLWRRLHLLIVLQLTLCKGQDIHVNIGVLMEESTLVERRALKLAIDSVNQDKNILADADLVGNLHNVTNGDAYSAAKTACYFAGSGVAALVTVASCPVQITLQSIGDSLHLPVLQVGFGYCGFPRLSGNYFFTSRPDEELMVRALSDYLYANRKRNIVLIYEEGADTTSIQTLFSSFSRNKRFEIRTTLIELPGSIETDVTENLKIINSVMELLHDHDQRPDGLLLFAKPSTSIHLISKIHVADPSESFHLHWIIPNLEISNDHLREIQLATHSSVVVIRHSIDENSKDVQKFVRSWNNELGFECIMCSKKYKSVGANDIPSGERIGSCERELPGNAAQISNIISAYYLYDGIRHLSSAFNQLLEEQRWKTPTPLNCQTRNVNAWSGGANLIEKIREVVIRTERGGQINSSGLLGKLNLNEKGYQKFANYQLISKLSGKDEVFKKITDWSSETEKQRIELIPVVTTNKTFRVATVEEPPFVFMEVLEDNTIKYTGFSIDLLDSLARLAGFNYTLYEVADRKYGTRLPNGSWNGLIGDILNGEADLAIAAMTITAQREKFVDFTKRYMDYSVGIVMKKPQKSANLFTFIYPFHPSVCYSQAQVVAVLQLRLVMTDWLFCILSALILVVVLIYVLNQVSPSRSHTMDCNDSSGHKFTIINCFWFVYSSLMQQGGELNSITLPVRVVTGFWWFFALIVASAYTANLAAFLTVTKMDTPIRNFHDLASQKAVQYGTVVDTSIYDHIMTKGQAAIDENSLYHKMAQTMNKTENRLSEAKLGFQRAETGTFAFLWDVAVIEYEVINHKTCALTTVSDSIYDKGYGIALEHGSPFRDMLSLGILDLQDKGDIDRLVGKWWPKGGKCSLDSASSAARGTELTLPNFAGVFCVLAAGLAFACILAGLEIILHIRKGRPYPPSTKAQNETKEIDHGSIVPSPDTDEEILVVLKKKAVLHCLAGSETQKLGIDRVQSTGSSWHGEKQEPSVSTYLCCHHADDNCKKKPTRDDDMVVLSSKQFAKAETHQHPGDKQQGTDEKNKISSSLGTDEQPMLPNSNPNSDYDLMMPTITSQYDYVSVNNSDNSEKKILVNSQFSVEDLRKRLLRQKSTFDCLVTSPSTSSKAVDDSVIQPCFYDNRQPFMTSQGGAYTLPHSRMYEHAVLKAQSGLERKGKRHSSQKYYSTWKGQERGVVRGDGSVPCSTNVVLNHKKDYCDFKMPRNSCV